MVRDKSAVVVVVLVVAAAAWQKGKTLYESERRMMLSHPAPLGRARADRFTLPSSFFSEANRSAGDKDAKMVVEGVSPLQR